MKTLDPALAAHLASGATTLCQCWKLTLRSGEAMGFTDHDRDLAFGGTLFEAEAGFGASEAEAALGLGVPHLEAAGALSSARISEARIAAGDFDDAGFELWRVNWQAPEQRVLLTSGNLGEVTRGGGAFTAELRGLAHRLNQPMGRLFRFGCDAVLGDARCGVDLSDPDLLREAAVAALRDGRRFTLDGGGDAPDGFFSDGACRFLSGAGQGETRGVKFHRLRGGAAEIELWEDAPAGLAPGDRLRLTAGCDRQFSTCRMKFGNAVNFRGFPHMPGDDFVTSYASHGSVAPARAGRGG